MKDGNGNTTTYSYDNFDRLFKVTNAKSETTTYTYYDNGNRKSVIYSNGSKEKYTYYANNLLNTLVNTREDGSIIDSYTYTYDKAGNQLTKDEIIGGTTVGTTSYTYDVLNRLLTVTEPTGKTTSYTYDKSGNRYTETIAAEDATTGSTVTTVNTYTYDTRNRLTTINSKVDNVLAKVTSYTYDNNGNQLTTTVKTYENGTLKSTGTTFVNTYDLHNQLIQSRTEDGTTVNNSYNAEGYRVSKEVITVDGSSEQTYYLYEAEKVILEVDENGNQKAWNVYGINLLGYNSVYDAIFNGATNMGKKEFKFNYNGDELIFWAWKGDYLNLGAGAEMGLYKRLEIDDTSTNHWIVDKSLSLPMTLTVDYKGKQIISYDPEKDDPEGQEQDKWWVTAFNPDYENAKPSQLTATVTVDFTNNKDMYNDFINSRDYLVNIDMWRTSEDNAYKLILTY